MEENSFGGRLAKNGINILDVKCDDGDVVAVLYEFRWRPTPGKSIWTKSVYFPSPGASILRFGEDIVDGIIRSVRLDRIEAEGGQYGGR